MLEVQKYLRNTQLQYGPPKDYIASIVPNTLRDLEDKYAIKAIRSKKYPSLYLFKYNQIESPFNEKIVRECRGLILDSQDNWSVVCFPFEKFFNLGEREHLQRDFNWGNYKVFHKLDGSLINLYYYGNTWNLSTSGNPDASGWVHDKESLTFYDLAYPYFRDILEYKDLDTNCTYMYELITEKNKNVVNYEDSSYYGLHLIGQRNNKTLEEYDISEHIPIDEKIKYYVNTGRAINCLIDLIRPRDIFTHYPDEYWKMLDDECKYEWKNVNNLKANESEGYVLVDDKFNRIKVKSEQYVALHYLKSGWSLSSAISVVIRGEVDEVSIYLREYRKDLLELESWFRTCINKLEKLWKQINSNREGLLTRKDLALEINKHSDEYLFINALFAKIDGTEIKDYIYSLPISKLRKTYEDNQVHNNR